MFGTIRKHQKWLWAVIITLTIISFVIYFGPQSKTGNGGSSANFGTISGQRISQEQFHHAKNEVLLQYFFMSGGNWYNDNEGRKNNFDPDQRAYGRLLLIQKEEQYGIRVNSEVAGRYATQMLQHLDRNNSGITPEGFVKFLQSPNIGMDYEDFDRFVRHELGIQELMAVIGTSGKLITPQEAQDLYRREHQELATEAVFFSASNYLASVPNPPEPVIAQFYTNQMAMYRVPNRIQVTYVKFAYSNYFSQAEKEVTNLTALVEENYTKMGTNTFPDAKTPEEVKTKIRSEILRRASDPLARKEANEFSRPLLEGNPPPPLATFPDLAKKSSHEAQVSAPFSRDEGPKEIEAGPDFSKFAFSLSETEPYAQPVRGLDGFYVIAFNKRIPSEVPSLASIRDRVTFDFKMSDAIRQAHMTGMAFSQSVSNGIAQGKTFDAIASEAKLKPVSLPPIAISTRSITNLDENLPLEFLKEVAFSTPPGKVSPFRPASQGGIVLHVKSTLPLDEARMRAELPGFTAYVRQTRQREAFEAWFRKEATRAITDAPILQQKQRAQGSASS